MDADDELPTNDIFETYDKHLTDEDVCLVGWTWREGKDHYNPPPPTMKEILIGADPYLAVWSKIWKRSSIKRRFPEKVVFEDVAFTIRGYIQANRITRIRKNCYIYHRRKDSISFNETTPENLAYRVEQKKDIRSIMEEYPEFAEYLEYLA
jgi:hypothetical protein